MNLKTISAQVRPRPRGWMFPKMEEKKPFTTVELEFTGITETCNTEFRLENFKYQSLKQIETVDKLNCENNPIVDSLEIKRVLIKKIDNKSIEVSCDAIGEGIKYAFYIYKNDSLIQKVPYSINSKLIFNGDAPGDYKVRVYVRDKSNNQTARNSKVLIIKTGE
ncbi:triple tyrosine motif-containing protein [Ferdinandcohnia sp. SAFN-114]|uniref:triple tyrosine motif-containing protein n=1 Tax=Ferdinandcohnia sp. SAFN-114 TaxID=3387275 RepID=UPI003F7D5B44